MIREAKGWTQREVASHLAITQSAYHKLENGDSDLSLTHCSRLAIVLDVPIGILLLGRDDGKTLDHWVLEEKVKRLESTSDHS